MRSRHRSAHWKIGSPALFEVRRMFWPRFEQFADPVKFDQGVGGFSTTYNWRTSSCLPIWQVHGPARQSDSPNAEPMAIHAPSTQTISPESILSSLSASTQPAPGSKRATRKSPPSGRFWMIRIIPCSYVLITTSVMPTTCRRDERLARQEIEFHHHGDPAIPAKQSFGDFGISLLNGLGLPIRNQFGLRPAKFPDGSPAPIKIAPELDRFALLDGVTTFNLHPHLPHFEMWATASQSSTCLLVSRSISRRRRILSTEGGRRDFDALLQTKPDVFPGCVLICDTTMWSSTAGGIGSLERFWRNVVLLKSAHA